MKDVGIRSLGSYLPEKRLTNADLEQMVDTSDEWIFTRTGIKERRQAAREEATSHMAAQAARGALRESGLAGADIGFVISSTGTHEYSCPSQAAKVAQALELPGPFCFDLNAACSGLVYALTVGVSLIRNGQGRFGLVTASEKMSALADYTDRATCILFGDGAGAAILASEPPFHRIVYTNLGADPAGADLVKMGGSPEHGTGDNHYFWQDGRAVYRFAVNKLKELIPDAMQRADIPPGGRYHIIPHQANQRMVESVAKDMGIPAERFVTNIEVRGNTSSASIGIAMAEAAAEGRFVPGDRLILLGFGGGLTWGTVVIEW